MWVTISFVPLAAWLWLYQGAISLDDGHWTPLPLELIWRYCGLAYPDLQWHAAQIIAGGALDLPIPLVAFVLACLVAWPEAKLEQAWFRWGSAAKDAATEAGAARSSAGSARERSAA